MDKNISSKRRLLLVVRWPVGGILTFFRYVYTKFDPHEWQITIVAPDFDCMGSLLSEFPGFDIKYIPVAKLPTNGSYGFKKMFRLISSELLHGGYDLVHSHGVSTGVCTLLPAVFSRTPHMLTLHDMFVGKVFGRKSGFIKKAALTIALCLIDRIHCVSNDSQKNLLEQLPAFKIRKDKISIIPHGIATERFLIEDKNDFRQALNISPDTFILGFFGRFMAPKGFRVLISAIENLSKRSLDRRFVVICFGWGGFVREEQELIASKGISDFFLFQPFQENIAPALRGVDAVVMPSLWEAYGLLAAEALVAGAPLIGTDCIGLREVLADTPARVVPAGNPQALADAILCEMEDSSAVVAEAYRAEAAERFDVRSQAAELQDLTRSLCRNAR